MVDKIAMRLPPEPVRTMDSRTKMNMLRHKEVGSTPPVSKYSSGRIDPDAAYRPNYLSPNCPSVAGMLMKK